MSNLKSIAIVVALGLGLSASAGLAQAVTNQDGVMQGAPWKLASADSAKPSLGTSSSLNDSDAAPSSSAVVAVPPQRAQKTQDTGRLRPFSRVAIGTRTGPLGIGGQIATPITRWLNLRGGVDFFNFNYGLTNDGANYKGQLHLKSGLVTADVFPFRRSGFHVSSGVLIFKTSVAGGLDIPGGNNFSMGDNSFTSSASDPVSGTGTLVFSRSIMPVVLFGFGNMIKGEHKHWSFPVEIGAAYTGHYTMQLAMTGTACTSSGCAPTTDPTFQASVTQEQNDINEQAKHYQIYPILTMGLAYKF